MPVTSRPQSFEKAFERLHSSITTADQIKFQNTTLKDVWEAAREIESNMGARQSLRNLRRIEPFLHGLRQYSTCIDTLCNGTPYLPWIWAPIKMMLEVASTFTSAFEKLIDAYALIAESMPRFDRFSRVFQDDPNFQLVLSFIYEDILEFHRRAYKFFCRRGWRIFFDATWKSFDGRFKAILGNLERHRDLVDREAFSINIVEAKEWRRKAEEESEKREAEQSYTQWRNALAWIEPSEHQEDIIERISDPCLPNSCDWIFNQPKIFSWMRSGPEPSILWLKGIPGAGKSVLASQLCKHIRAQNIHTPIYYFFTSYHIDQNICSKMLKALIVQLLRINLDLAPHILENFAFKGFAPSISHLKTLLQHMLHAIESVRIVVDGMDECDEKDHRPVLSILMGSTKASNCKVLISSREGGTIAKLLRNKSTINLKDEYLEVDKSITLFIDQGLREVRERFEDVAHPLIDNIQQKMVKKAAGMFLWARLVLATLQDVHSIGELQLAIESLPEGLGEAYGRILARITQKLSSLNRGKAIRMLYWIAFSRRPLQKSELLDGIVFYDENSVLDQNSKLTSDCLDLCKPIIEESPTNTVVFVHFSAKEFLLDPSSGPFLHEAIGEYTIALSCVSYLSSSFLLIDPEHSQIVVKRNILQGYHGLQLYANEFWLQHLLAFSKGSNTCFPDINYEALVQRLQKFCSSHEKLQILRSHIPSFSIGLDIDRIETDVECLKYEPSAKKLALQLLAFRQALEKSQGEGKCLEEDSTKDEDPTSFTSLRARYQSIVEEILTTETSSSQAEEKQLASFKSVYGYSAFPCRYRSCVRSSMGFPSKQARSKHENDMHPSLLYCIDTRCAFSQMGFRTARALKAHDEKYHSTKPDVIIPSSIMTNSLSGPQLLFEEALEETAFSSVPYGEDSVGALEYDLSSQSNQQSNVSNQELLVGTAVAYRQPKPKKDDSRWFHCTIINIVTVDSYKRYEVQDVEPEEFSVPGQSYNASAADLIRIPDPHDTLSEFPLGKRVLAPYPKMRGFHPAEITGVKKKSYRLKYKHNQDDKIYVEKRFVLDITTSDIVPTMQGQHMAEQLLSGEDVIKCRCNNPEDGSPTVQCRKCETWQHVFCYYVQYPVPDVHECRDCMIGDNTKEPMTDILKRKREQIDIVSGETAVHQNSIDINTRHRQRGEPPSWMTPEQLKSWWEVQLQAIPQSAAGDSTLTRSTNVLQGPPQQQSMGDSNESPKNDPPTYAQESSSQRSSQQTRNDVNDINENRLMENSQSSIPTQESAPIDGTQQPQEQPKNSVAEIMRKGSHGMPTSYRTGSRYLGREQPTTDLTKTRDFFEREEQKMRDILKGPFELIPKLKDTEVHRTDSAPLPSDTVLRIAELGIPSVPEDVKTWSQLKFWAAQKPILSRNRHILKAIDQLQARHFYQDKLRRLEQRRVSAR